MNTLRRFLPFALVSVAGLAHGQISFSSIAATYSLTPGTGSIAWVIHQNQPPGSIDFTQNAPAFKVGDHTGISSGTSSITYNVTSTAPVTSIDLLLQGDVQDFGRIQYGESINGGSLGSVTGSILGASYTGGTNGEYTRLVHLDFTQAVTAFSVTQTLTADVNGQTLPSTSVASVGIVEQNFAVPEPTTIAGIALGVAALARRKKNRAR